MQQQPGLQHLRLGFQSGQPGQPGQRRLCLGDLGRDLVGIHRLELHQRPGELELCRQLLDQGHTLLLGRWPPNATPVRQWRHGDATPRGNEQLHGQLRGGRGSRRLPSADVAVVLWYHLAPIHTRWLCPARSTDHRPGNCLANPASSTGSFWTPKPAPTGRAISTSTSAGMPTVPRATPRASTGCG